MPVPPSMPVSWAVFFCGSFAAVGAVGGLRTIIVPAVLWPLALLLRHIERGWL